MESSLGGGERGEGALLGEVGGNDQSSDGWQRALRRAGVGVEAERGPDGVCESAGGSDCSGRGIVGGGKEGAGLLRVSGAGQARVWTRERSMEGRTTMQ